MTTQARPPCSSPSNREHRVVAGTGEGGPERIAEGSIKPDNPVDEPHHYINRVDRPRRSQLSG